MWQTVRTNWFSNVRGDVLAAMVVALALIPEAVAFSIIAGVDPKVGLYASFCILVVTAFMGGRPGMISAATGAMALVMVTLVRDHGLEYLLAATVLTGILQIIAGYLKLANLMRFVSRSVVTGFVNALAILIFLAQVPEFTGENFSLTVILFIAAGLGIIYGLPYITKAVPSPLVALVVLTVVAIYFGVDLRTVGDMGDLPDTLPVFLIPDIPLNLETLKIIFPYSITLAVVGLLESMMTATIVDDLTDTPSDKNRESKGQGYANVVTGFFGGMAGCAMIGQSIINIKSGGRTRLSTLLAGLFLLFLIVALGPWVSQIPMGALVAVMIMVSIGTFSWSSLIDLKKHPLSTNIVMVVTVAVVVYTHNLAIGVFVGILLAAMFFANKVGHYMHVSKELDSTGTERRYLVVGQVFFSSSDKFISSFDFREAIDKVVIDLSHAHFWDITAVGALDKVVLKFRREGTEVEVIGLNEASETIVDRFGEHDKPGALDKLLSGH
ncbi:SulP family inorganic anion transporter [Salinispirillum sp. LH 10-3-1]|uniref:SulP family inorganic anion transporter n=1 Tax=Salinispirillum sp. LH 10-3-1 TaxID=2952525 RepID=A0AB38YGC5_9GAMM